MIYASIGTRKTYFETVAEARRWLLKHFPNFAHSVAQKGQTLSSNRPGEAGVVYCLSPRQARELVHALAQ